MGYLKKPTRKKNKIKLEEGLKIRIKKIFLNRNRNALSTYRPSLLNLR